MGDRTTVYFRFGGALPAEKAGYLQELIEASCGRSNELRDSDAPALTTLDDEFVFDEVNYAQLPDLEGFARSNGLSYVKRWDEGGSYGPGVEVFDATSGQSVEMGSLQGNGPALTWEAIKALSDALAEGETLLQRLDREFRRADGEGVPLLRIAAPDGADYAPADYTWPQPPEPTGPLQNFTAFCQEASGRGTIWISQVEATDVKAARAAALEACRNDWGGDAAGFDPGDIHCLGIAAGKVDVLDWHDLNDD